MQKMLTLFLVFIFFLLTIGFNTSTTHAYDTPFALSYIVATSSATSTWQGGATFGLTSGFLGIGTANPLAPIQVGD